MTETSVRRTRGIAIPAIVLPAVAAAVFASGATPAAPGIGDPVTYQIAQRPAGEKRRTHSAPERDPKTGHVMPIFAFKQQLSRLGYDPGPTSKSDHLMLYDNFINERLVTSVRRFQRDNGLKADGRMSFELLDLMKKQVEARRKTKRTRAPGAGR